MKVFRNKNVVGDVIMFESGKGCLLPRSILKHVPPPSRCWVLIELASVENYNGTILGSLSWPWPRKTQNLQTKNWRRRRTFGWGRFATNSRNIFYEWIPQFLHYVVQWICILPKWSYKHKASRACMDLSNSLFMRLSVLLDPQLEACGMGCKEGSWVSSSVVSVSGLIVGTWQRPLR